VPEQLTPSGIPSVFLELDKSVAKTKKFVTDPSKSVVVGEKLGGTMERVLGVPVMKSRVHALSPDGVCDECDKEGYLGRGVTVRCSECHAFFCTLECSSSHMCPGPTLTPSLDFGASPNRPPAPKAMAGMVLFGQERGESLGGDMERLLGVPSMKSGVIPSGRCASCNTEGEYGSGLKVTCAKCRANFCHLECSAAHQCPGPKEVELTAAPMLDVGGRRKVRRESLGGDMERLLGVPSMKSGKLPNGSCSICQKSGQHGKALTVKCSKCNDIFCNLACSEKHECRKAGGFLGLFKKKSPSPVRHSNSSNSNAK
jgi:hypothetical protein